jgi:hypothetical protein
VLTVTVESYYTGTSPVATNKLNVALLQNNTLGPQTGGNMGNNYNHQHRLVHMLTGQWGTTISSTTTGSFISGLHFADLFTSNTTGALVFLANPPNSDTESSITTSFSSQGSGWTGGQGLSLDTTGEFIIAEMQYFAKGHTGFTNTAPTLTGSQTAFLTYEYQIDTGSGYGGTWKTLNGTNLSSETVSASTGFKLKLKITANSNNTATRIDRILVGTTSTLSAQADNLYTLDTATLSFTGLQPGTEVRAYTGTDPATAVEIGAVESTLGSTFSFTHSAAGLAGYIQIFALGYQPITIPYTYTAEDDSLLIQQVIDRNYVNPV